MTIITKSPEETIAFAEKLGSLLKRGDIINFFFSRFGNIIKFIIKSQFVPFVFSHRMIRKNIRSLNAVVTA